MQKIKRITKDKKMAIKYVVYKRYEKRVGKGNLPEIITVYLSEELPHIDFTRNIDDAIRFDESEAKQIAYITYMDYKELG